MREWFSKLNSWFVNLTEPMERFSADDEARKQYLTQVVLILMCAALLLFTLLVAAGWGTGMFSWGDLTIMFALDAPIVVCLWLARRGQWRWGSYLAPALMFGLGVTGSSLGGLGTMFVIFYGLAILLAGMLIGNRAQWVMVGLCTITHVGLVGVYELRPLGEQLAVAITLSGGFVGIALLQWFSTRQLHHALMQARATAVDLRAEIAERQRTERALRESQAMLQLIFDHAFDGISVYEEDLEHSTRRLVDCNVRYAEIAGRSRQELLDIGNTMPIQKDVGIPIDHSQFVERLDAGVYIGHFSWLRPDGRDNVVEYAAVPLHVDDRFLTIGVDHDITAQVQATQEREAMIEELEAKNAELERFTYTVSHDLKSPLITIGGFVGFLEKDALAGDIERVKADMAHINDAIYKMQRLLGELLELSRIGRLMNPSEEASFEAIVREAVELVRGRIAARGVHVEIAPNLPLVYGDRARLVEVVQNLLDNACKFMGDQPHPRVEIGARQEDSKTVFYVRDNGMGIAPQHHDKVFGLFEKLDPTTEGTGIGLAIVRRIVEVHGGRVWVESAGPRQGSVFCFTLKFRV